MSKRDGRREWLRATKLARSIQAALTAAGESDPDRSLDLATGLVGSLRVRESASASGDVLETSRIAELVHQRLIERGYTLAALLYAEAGRRAQPSAFDVGGSRSFWSDERLFGRS